MYLTTPSGIHRCLDLMFVCCCKSPAPGIAPKCSGKVGTPTDWSKSQIIQFRKEVAGLVESLGSLHEDSSRLSFEALEAVQGHVLSDFDSGVNSQEATAALQCQIEAMTQMVVCYKMYC